MCRKVYSRRTRGKTWSRTSCSGSQAHGAGWRPSRGRHGLPSFSLAIVPKTKLSLSCCISHFGAMSTLVPRKKRRRGCISAASRVAADVAACGQEHGGPAAHRQMDTDKEPLFPWTKEAEIRAGTPGTNIFWAGVQRGDGRTGQSPGGQPGASLDESATHVSWQLTAVGGREPGAGSRRHPARRGPGILTCQSGETMPDTQKLHRHPGTATIGRVKHCPGP